jgi:hypothetical protein
MFLTDFVFLCTYWYLLSITINFFEHNLLKLSLEVFLLFEINIPINGLIIYELLISNL